MTSPIRVRRLLIAAYGLLGMLLLGAVWAPRAHAQSFPSLSAAGNFGVLELTGGNLTTDSLVTVNGNEGAVYDSFIQNNGPSTINGNVYVDMMSQYSGAGTVNGSVITDAENSDPNYMKSNGTVQTAVNNAVTTIQGDNFPMSGSFYFGSGISSNTNLSAAGTLNLVYVNGAVNLNDMNLTLNGTSSQYFIVEVTGALSLTGTASLDLSGGMTSSNVIYYFPGTNGTSCNVSTHVGDTMNGIFLAPSTSCDLKSLDGTFNGEIISAGDITLLSNAVVNAPTPPVPEPASMTLLGAGLLAVGGVFRKRARRA